MAFAILFDGVGVGEWFVLLAVVLIVVGPNRLPSAARKFGQYYSRFRRAAETFKRQLLDMDTEFTNAVRDAKNEVESAMRDAENEIHDVESGFHDTMNDFSTDYARPEPEPAAENGTEGNGDKAPSES